MRLTDEALPRVIPKSLHRCRASAAADADHSTTDCTDYADEMGAENSLSEFLREAFGT